MDDNTSFQKLSSRRGSFVADRQRGIFYQRKEIQANVKKLMEHKCQFCPDRPPERYFDRLRDHIKKEHGKFFCDICVAHLQKFSWEFKVYARSELARHRRIGDEDDKSHKGHPLCEFCEERFLDNDELHKHLRKNHFWCHFCERDGCQDYYANYASLHVHFRDFHFLCEEGDCVREQYTSVFRTKVDLQAHRAAKHTGNLTKAQARQARQLDVDITFAPRPRPQANQNSVISGRDFAEVKASEERRGKREKSGNRGGASGQNRSEKLDVETAMALSLSNAKDPSDLPSPSSKPQEPKKYKAEENSEAAELPSSEVDSFAHFPSLLGSLEVTNKEDKPMDAKPCNNSHLHSNVLSASSSLNSEDDFPALGTSAHMPKQAHTVPPGFAAAARQPSTLVASQQTFRAKPPPGFEETACVSAKENVARACEVSAPKPEVEVNTSNQERNQILVEKIRRLLGYDKSKFDEFKAMSGKFRKGTCSAKEYYNECCNLFGKNFQLVFSELVDLLPDEERQKELLSVHQDAKICASHQDGNKSTAGKPHKARSRGVWQSGDTAWSTGMQSNGVSETDFPSLPVASKRSYTQPRYRTVKSGTVLKQAWIRGK